MRGVQVAVKCGAVLGAALLLSGCATSVTHRVQYPASDDLFVTMGDDPGTESLKAYSPKGSMIHVSTEWYLPIPVLGLMTFGNANPQYVFEKKILPKIRAMGGDALSNARVEHVPPPNEFMRLLGFPLLFTPVSSTIVTGQVDKR